MFDLNDSIRCWRSAFSQHEECSAEDVQELESHLREEVAALERSGLSEQEAFSVSVSRLGPPDEVCGEYAKADPGQLWGHRIYWMAAGVVCWLSVRSLLNALGALAAGMTLLLGVRHGVAFRIAGVAAGLCSLSALVWCAWACYSRGLPQGIVSRLTALTATRTRRVACIVGFLAVRMSAWVTSLLLVRRFRTFEAVNAYVSIALIRTVLSVAFLVVIVVFVVSQAGRRCGSAVPTTR